MDDPNLEYSCSVCNTVVSKTDSICPTCGTDLSEEIYPDDQLKTIFSIIKNYLSKHNKYLIISLWLLIFLLMYLYRYKMIALTLGEYKQVFPDSVVGTSYYSLGLRTFNDSIYNISCRFCQYSSGKRIRWNGDTINNPSVSCGIKYGFLKSEIIGYDSAIIEIKVDSFHHMKRMTRLIPIKVGETKIYFNLDHKKGTLNIKVIKQKNNLIIEEII